MGFFNRKKELVEHIEYGYLVQWVRYINPIMPIRDEKWVATVEEIDGVIKDAKKNPGCRWFEVYRSKKVTYTLPEPRYER